MALVLDGGLVSTDSGATLKAKEQRPDGTSELPLAPAADPVWSGRGYSDDPFTLSIAAGEGIFERGEGASGRRSAVLDHSPHQDASFGPFRLIANARLLLRDDEAVPVGSRAFDLLSLLVERAGTVIAKRDLMARGWPDLTVDETSLRVQIAGLRRALGDGVQGARYISNVPGRGYCFVATVDVAEPDARTAPAEDVRPHRRVQGAVSHLIGRDEIVLKAEFLLHAHRLVTVHGPGGIGKTTVAKAVASLVGGAFEDRVVFLDVGSIRDPDLLVSALATALGLVVHDKEVLPKVVALLRDTRALIVFDSCEHAIIAVSVLAETIHLEAPGVSILVTSREPLRIAGERVVPLSGLALPDLDRALSPNQALEFPAIELFAERAFAAGYPGVLDEADIATVIEICHALDGIPLAIEIAASRAGKHGIVETAQLLDGNFRLSWQGRRSAPSRHQTLHATLDWSYNLLSEEERHVLLWLSVFDGRFSHAAAEAVAPPRLADCSRVVDDLVSKSMLDIELVEGAASYRLLDTTRAYARAKLGSRPSDEKAAKTQLVRHVARELARANPRSSRKSSGEISGAVDLLADVRSALAWSFSQPEQAAEALELVALAAPFFFSNGLFDECRSWLERALGTLSAGEHSHLAEMKIEGAYGMALMLTLANSLRAQAAFERAIELAEQASDWQTAFGMNVRLLVLHNRTAENYDLLLPLSERSEAYAERLDDQTARDSALLIRGSSHVLCGNLIEAENLLREAQRRQQSHSPDPQHFAFPGDARVPLSLTLWLRGRPDEAARAAEAIGETSHDVFFSCIAWSWAAIVQQSIGNSSASSRLAERLRQTADRHALQPYQAVGAAFHAHELLEQGAVEEALRKFERSICLLREARYGIYESIFSRALAEAMADAGDLGGAVQLIQPQLAKIEAMGGSYDQPEWMRIWGHVDWLSGRADSAERKLRDAMALAVDQGAVAWRLRAATSLSRLMKVQDRREEAAWQLRSALEPYEEGFGTRDLIEASGLLKELAC